MEKVSDGWRMGGDFFPSNNVSGTRNLRGQMPHGAVAYYEKFWAETEPEEIQDNIPDCCRLTGIGGGSGAHRRRASRQTTDGAGTEVRTVDDLLLVYVDPQWSAGGMCVANS